MPEQRRYRFQCSCRQFPGRAARRVGHTPSGTMGTPSAAPCPPPPPPAFAPSAAAINCNSFCGSFNHCLNSGPSVWAAICAAMLTSPVSGSAATNFTSLILIVLPSLPPPTERFFDLLGNVLCFRSGNRESAYQAREVFDRYVFGEVQAGQSGRVQQGARSCARRSRFPAECHRAAACCRKRPAGSPRRR